MNTATVNQGNDNMRVLNKESKKTLESKIQTLKKNLKLLEKDESDGSYKAKLSFYNYSDLGFKTESLLKLLKLSLMNRMHNDDLGVIDDNDMINVLEVILELQPTNEWEILSEIQKMP